MDIEHLHSIRSAELDCILPILAEYSAGESGSNAAILEIGAGTGWQAKQLSERKYDVEAIDIAASNYRNEQVWPVTTYDGVDIPFPDGRFDILLSSNVLEHIPHLEDFHNEMQRVLKPGGIAIHIVPSGSWRLWTNVAHYPFIIKTAIAKIIGRFTREPSLRTDDRLTENTSESEAASVGRSIVAALYPQRHGESGNALSEIYLFSRFGWSKLFRQGGWRLRLVYSNKLFYTGYMFLGSLLRHRARRVLSYVLGGSCHIFVLDARKEDR